MSSDLATVERRILTIRGQRVILASDLAQIYGVAAKALNQAVKRNRDRFPADFAFRLTPAEAEQARRSRSQFVTLKRGLNVKYAPLAFTDHGAIMAATVLNSAQAVQMSIFVVRAFSRLRAMVIGRSELAARLTELERQVGTHDGEIRTIIRAIRQLIQPVENPRRRRIGFGDRSRS